MEKLSGLKTKAQKVQKSRVEWGYFDQTSPCACFDLTACDTNSLDFWALGFKPLSLQQSMELLAMAFA